MANGDVSPRHYKEERSDSEDRRSSWIKEEPRKEENEDEWSASGSRPGNQYETRKESYQESQSWGWERHDYGGERDYRDSRDMGNLPHYLEAPSRELAMILRHKASRYGIDLDKENWVKVDDLSKAKSLRDVSLNDIETIVQESYSKKRPRFEMREWDGVFYVRATHKHSSDDSRHNRTTHRHSSGDSRWSDMWDRGRAGRGRDQESYHDYDRRRNREREEDQEEVANIMPSQTTNGDAGIPRGQKRDFQVAEGPEEGSAAGFGRYKNQRSEPKVPRGRGSISKYIPES